MSSHPEDTPPESRDEALMRICEEFMARRGLDINGRKKEPPRQSRPDADYRPVQAA